MSARNAASRASGLAESGGASGPELRHDFFLTLSDWVAVSAVAEALASAGADVQSLQLARCGDGYGARCRLARLSEKDARALSSALLDRGVVQSATVEHLLLAADRAP